VVLFIYIFSILSMQSASTKNDRHECDGRKYL
jgi:hypothetical protein